MSQSATLVGAVSFEQLLARITVKSFAPGRIRFRLDFKGDAFLRDAVRRELQRIPSVRLVSYSSRTQTALVLYDPASVKPETVGEAICRGVKEFARVHGECDLVDHKHDLGVRVRPAAEHGHEPHEDDGHDHGHDHAHLASDEGVRKEAVKLLAEGLVLGWLVARRLRRAPPLAGGGPLTDVGMLLTIVSGYPIFRSGAKSAARDRRRYRVRRLDRRVGRDRRRGDEPRSRDAHRADGRVRAGRP